MALAFMPKPIRELPWRMLVLVILIAGFRLLVLYSAAGGEMTWALPQGVRFVVFLGMAIAMSRLRPEWIKQAAFPAYVIVLLLLVFVEALGFVGGGAQRWLDLGPLNLQPSELMKPVIVLACAHFYSLLPAREIRGLERALARRAADRHSRRPDPDPARPRHRDDGRARRGHDDVPRRRAAAAVRRRRGWRWRWRGPIAFSFLHDYQRQRVLIFLESRRRTRSRTGYHITQSKIAIGSGGLTGTGFLQGTQSHYRFLPEPHTDFIFATMAEEWGLIGGLFLIVAFALILRWGMSVAIECERPLLPPRRGGPDHDDLLLRRDQPDDGDGPGPRRRHPAAALLLWRLGDDDGDDLPRPADGDRAAEPARRAAGAEAGGRGQEFAGVDRLILKAGPGQQSRDWGCRTSSPSPAPSATSSARGRD